MKKVSFDIKDYVGTYSDSEPEQEVVNLKSGRGSNFDYGEPPPNPGEHKFRPIRDTSKSPARNPQGRSMASSHVDRLPERQPYDPINRGYGEGEDHRAIRGGSRASTSHEIIPYGGYPQDRPLGDETMIVPSGSDVEVNSYPGGSQISVNPRGVELITPANLFGASTSRRSGSRTTRPTRSAPRSNSSVPNYSRGTYVAPRYTPYDSYYAQEDSILDLDCVVEPEKEIDGFFRRVIMLQMLNNETLRTRTAINVYLEAHMRGIARKHWNHIPDTREAARAVYPNADPNYLVSLELFWEQAQQNGPDYIKRIQQHFRATFSGYSNSQTPTDLNKKTNDAIRRLNNLTICNICYWRNFTCEYAEYLYDIDEPVLRRQWELNYFNKLPPMWADLMHKRWAERPTHIADSFGGMQRMLRDEIEKRCEAKALTRDLKYQQNECCGDADFRVPGQYGCTAGKSYCAPCARTKTRTKTVYRNRPSDSRTSRRSSRRSSYPRRRRYRRWIPRYRRSRRSYTRSGTGSRTYRPGEVEVQINNNTGGGSRTSYRNRRPASSRGSVNNYTPRYRRRGRTRRRYNQANEADPNCPDGKKSCRCWLCQEEGHYANECPKKGEKKFENKQLILINSIGFEPIESEGEEDDEESSEYEIDLEYEEKEFSDSEDIGSDWEPVTDTEEESEDEDEWKWIPRK